MLNEQESKFVVTGVYMWYEQEYEDILTIHMLCE